MNSIKRFTKRVQNFMFVLTMDVRGAEAGFSPALAITGIAGVGAAAAAAQYQFGNTKATLNSAGSGSDAVTSKLTGIAGGQATPTPSAVDPTSP